MFVHMVRQVISTGEPLRTFAALHRWRIFTQLDARWFVLQEDGFRFEKLSTPVAVFMGFSCRFDLRDRLIPGRYIETRLG